MGYNGMTDLLLSNFFFFFVIFISVCSLAIPRSPPSLQDMASCSSEIDWRGRYAFFFEVGDQWIVCKCFVQSYERILCFSKDLMLPGVVVPSCGLPDVKQGDSCAVTLVNNRYVILNTFGRPFLKNVSVTVSFGLFLEHLLQLGQLLCPLNRCTVWVWKEEESAFFTRTWIISGESLSP